MTTTRRVRAGQPFECTQSGCNAPQSECSGACIRQYVASKAEPEDLPDDFAGYEPWPMPVRIAIVIFLTVICAAGLLPLFI